MIVGLTAKNDPKALALAATTIERLDREGHRSCMDPDTAEWLGRKDEACHEKKDLGHHSDMLVTLGGDGTLLSVARHAPPHVPIIGVNMGTLGFLTEIRPEEFEDVLAAALAGRAQCEPRGTLEAFVEGREEPQRVLNDVVVNKGALARIIEMSVEVDGTFVSSFRADGLIVATPTGSTAYNLSAGGPVLYPTVPAIIITPICPHMLTNRPIVLPDHLEITICLRDRPEEVYLTLDGQEAIPLTEAGKVVVRKSEHKVCLIHSPSKDYFRVLRRKLKWGGGENRFEGIQ
jgi:NAD+ kinase